MNHSLAAKKLLASKPPLHFVPLLYSATRHNALSSLTFRGLGLILVLVLVMLIPAQANTAKNEAATLAKYNNSCAVCHASGRLNAPKTGDKQVWNRLKAQKGMPTLVDAVKNGISSMPAGGLCNDCSDADYHALILYMSQ